MPRRILTGGLLVGFAAGLLLALLHLLLVHPVLHAAERYGRGDRVHQLALIEVNDHGAAASDGASDGAGEPLAPSPPPTLDPARDAVTVLFFGLAYAGFGLLLAAATAAADLPARQACWRGTAAPAHPRLAGQAAHKG